jgi:hypothetical protein
VIELGRCLLLETEKVLALTGSNPTTDPAEARILKFINRFAGKGWVKTRMVTHWWSGKTKPSANDIRAFIVTSNSQVSQSQPGNLLDEIDVDSIPLATEDDF